MIWEEAIETELLDEINDCPICGHFHCVCDYEILDTTPNEIFEEKTHV